MTEGRGNTGDNMRLCLPLAGNQQAQQFPDFMEGQEDMETSMFKEKTAYSTTNVCDSRVYRNWGSY